ncbi:HAD family hydrolase [Propionicicella superfundia]|uniref:HAD family hydrolase n=1 Tax=Propionicicella superfundia TaxID=348582 RepID=UPI0003FA3881|nr:HAD family phosphatase [Propionicicella superfundia]
MAATTTPGVTALLLDLDGTLVNSEAANDERLRRVCAARGWTYSDDLAALFPGRRPDDVFASEPGPWAGEDPAELMALMVALTPREALEPVPGAAGLVRHAAARVPVALVTSAVAAWAEMCLDEVLGVRELFTTIVTREHVERGKPDPEPYALACARLGVAPRNAVAVEDAPAGLISAAAAGVGTTVGLTGTFTASGLAMADRIVTSLADVEALL